MWTCGVGFIDFKTGQITYNNMVYGNLVYGIEGVTQLLLTRGISLLIRQGASKYMGFNLASLQKININIKPIYRKLFTKYHFYCQGIK